MPRAPIAWVECPRDAWQGLARPVPTDAKVAHATHLLEAGFSRIDLGSFVSPAAVPQMADTEAVVAGLRGRGAAELLCIVGNLRGVERAGAAEGVTAVGYPLSVSDTFQRRNLRRTVADSWPQLAEIRAAAAERDLELVVYLSMAFGNPYGDPWRPGDTAAALERARTLGVARIALADTVGRAGADTVDAVLGAVGAEAGRVGLHLHARPDAWEPLVAAGLERGVRWFEGALAGVGGCPFAGDALVGNLPTERVLPFLAALGFDAGVDPDALGGLSAEAARLAARYGGPEGGSGSASAGGGA